jgi:TPR repeat protein
MDSGEQSHGAPEVSPIHKILAWFALVVIGWIVVVSVVVVSFMDGWVGFVVLGASVTILMASPQNRLARRAGLACLIAALMVYSRDQGPLTDSTALFASQSNRAPSAAAAPSDSATFAEATAPSVSPAPLPAPQSNPTPSAEAEPSNSATFAEAAAPSVSPVPRPKQKAAPRKAVATPQVAPSPALSLRSSGYAELNRRRYPEALSLLQQATALGDPDAPMYLGKMFENGLGVAKDAPQASYWYRVAVERGNGDALSALDHIHWQPLDPDARRSRS